jgi:hypothetical protein
VDSVIVDTKEAVSSKEYHAYVLDTYLIVYPPDMNVETFAEKWYYGIIFRTEKGKYEVMHNYASGNRILLHFHDGSWDDVPFKPATFGFLPEGVEAIEIE